MSQPAATPRTAAIIVAGGSGSRSGLAQPKQFALWNGKPVLRHSAESFARLGLAPIVVAIPEGCDDLAQAALAGLPGIVLVHGGVTRQASVRSALAALAGLAPDRVLVHDAARPDCPDEVVDRLLAALDGAVAAIPVLPVVDSLAEASGDQMGAPAPRERLRRVQTPQAFRYTEFVAAQASWPGEPTAGDDAQVAQAAGHGVALVEGDERLRKLTFASDFGDGAPPVRIGTGYDVHRLAAGEELWLCGVRIAHDRGLSGHSDADVAIHALVDAILGALGDGDIGSHFPPSDPRWRGAASSAFLDHAVTLARAAGYEIGNLDITIICEAPKIGPHRDAMRQSIAKIAGCMPGRVSVKATTTEGLGFAGRGEGIAAQAAALLLKIER